MAGLVAYEVAIILVPIVTLIFGILIGWLAQRSGFCSIGGFRDLLLFKQTRLFFGFLSLIVGSFIGYLIFDMIATTAFPSFPKIITGGLTPLPGAPATATIYGTLFLAILGGFGMGLLGVLLGGCPLRQIVMSTEGNIKSIFFVIGTLIGAVLFHMYVASWLVGLLNTWFPL